jgi:hypothetical protein
MEIVAVVVVAVVAPIRAEGGGGGAIIVFPSVRNILRMYAYPDTYRGHCHPFAIVVMCTQNTHSWFGSGNSLGTTKWKERRKARRRWRWRRTLSSTIMFLFSLDDETIHLTLLKNRIQFYAKKLKHNKEF